MKSILIFSLLVFSPFQSFCKDTLISEITGITNDYVNLFLHKNTFPDSAKAPKYTSSFTLIEGEDFHFINLFYAKTRDSIDQEKSCGQYYVLDSLTDIILNSYGDTLSFMKYGRDTDTCFYQNLSGPFFNLGRLPEGEYLVRDAMKNLELIDSIELKPRPLVNIYSNKVLNEIDPLVKIFERHNVIDNLDNVIIEYENGVYFNWTSYQIGKSEYKLDNDTILFSINYDADENIKSSIVKKRVYEFKTTTLDTGYHKFFHENILLDSFLVHKERRDDFFLETSIVPMNDTTTRYGAFPISVLVGMNKDTQVSCNEWVRHYPGNYWLINAGCDTCKPVFQAYSSTCTITLQYFPAYISPPNLFPYNWKSRDGKYPQYGYQDITIEYRNFDERIEIRHSENRIYDLVWGSVYSFSPPIIFGEINISGNTDSIERINKKRAHFFVNPNPFNPATVISFPNEKRKATLTIFDIKGRQIFKRTGIREQSLRWNASGHANGIYLLKVISENKTYQKKLVLQK